MAVLDEYRALRAYRVFRAPHFPVSGTFKGGNRVRACRLHLAQITLLAIEGDPAQAASELQAGLALWRGILGQEGNLLLDRLTALAVIARYAQTASHLLRSGYFGPVEAGLMAKAFAPLSVDERRMHGTLEVEGVTIGLIGDYEIFKDAVPFSLEDLPRWLPYGVIRAFYRRNWVANQIFRRAIVWNEIDRMTAREFKANLPDAQRIVTRSFRPVGLVQYLFNGVGVFVGTTPPPECSKYIARAHDLDANVRLVGLQAQIKAAQIPPDKVADFVAAAGAETFDPYTEAPMKYDPEAGTLSFDVLYEKYQGLVPVRIRPRK
jgi:hypothetical protein